MRQQQARLQVIAGPMFSGKSEELLRRVRRAKVAGLHMEVISHALDVRKGAGIVSTHAGLSIESRTATDVGHIWEVAGNRSLDLLAIDEAQFFGPELVPTVSRLLAEGTTVLLAGLCVRFDGEPFDPVPGLMALAEDVSKLTAVCSRCGADAVFHQRSVPSVVDDAGAVTAELVGGAESYQALCRRHFHPQP